MAKSSLERSIEKQQQEANRIANQEARQKRAESIINGQPIIGGMRIMDKASEEILQVILNIYYETQNNAVSGEASLFPEMYHSSLALQFEKLSMYGMIISAHLWLGGSWIATVTPQGVTYFEDKKRAMETMEPKNNQAFSDNFAKAAFKRFMVSSRPRRYAISNAPPGVEACPLIAMRSGQSTAPFFLPAAAIASMTLSWIVVSVHSGTPSSTGRINWRFSRATWGSDFIFLLK